MMEFWSELEWEIKFRVDRDDILNTIFSIAEDFWGPLRLSDTKGFRDTYYDTHDRLLAHSDRSLRHHMRGHKNRLVYKYAVNNLSGLLVRREIMCEPRGHVMDFGNLFHQRFPIFAELSDFLGSSAVLKPSIILDIRRKGYIAATSLCNIEWPIYFVIDEVNPRTVVEAPIECSHHVVEIEVELCHLFPAGIERAIAFKDRVTQETGCQPVASSKYQHCLQLYEGGATSPTQETSRLGA